MFSQNRYTMFVVLSYLLLVIPSVLSQEEIRVGFMSPIDGGSAIQYMCCGEPAGFGFTLAVEKAQADPDMLTGYNIVPIYNNTNLSNQETIFATLDQVDLNVVGIVGDMSSRKTSLVQYVASFYDLPQLAYAATSTSFSDKSEYPTFSRTVAGDSDQGRALAILVQFFEWTRVAVLHGSDDYSRDLADEFITQCGNLNVRVLASQSYPSGQVDDVSSQLAVLSEAGARIFLLAGTGEDVTSVFQQAKGHGIVGDDYAWIGPDAWISQETLSEDMLTLAQGSVGTIPLVDSDGDTYAAVDSAWRASGTKNRFPSVNPDNGLQLWGAYAYDATWALLLALDEMVDAGVDPRLEQNKPALLSTIRSQVFAGTTGEVRFNTTTGDRVAGYSVVNLHEGVVRVVGSYERATHGETDVMEVTSAVYWSDGSTKIPADDLVCDGKYEVKDEDDNVCVDMTTYYVGFGVLAGLLAFLSVASMVLCLIFRNHVLIKSSSVMFCMITCLGILLMSVSVFFELEDLNCMFNVILFETGFAVMFGSLFSKAYRIYRVTKLASHSARVVRIPNKTLLGMLGLIVAGQWVILGIYWATDDECSVGSPGYVLLIVYEACLLTWGSFLAHRVRGMKTFGDAKPSAYTIFATVVFFVLTIPLAAIVEADPKAFFMLNGMKSLAPGTFCMAVLFVPKFYSILAGGAEETLKIAPKICKGVSLNSENSENSMNYT